MEIFQNKVELGGRIDLGGFKRLSKSVYNHWRIGQMLQELRNEISKLSQNQYNFPRNQYNASQNYFCIVRYLVEFLSVMSRNLQ